MRAVLAPAERRRRHVLEDLCRLHDGLKQRRAAAIERPRRERGRRGGPAVDAEERVVLGALRLRLLNLALRPAPERRLGPLADAGALLAGPGAGLLRHQTTCSPCIRYSLRVISRQLISVAAP